MMEMLVVVSIIGVMGTLAAGRISQTMTQQRVLRASQAIRNDIEAAFAIAARNRQPIRMAWSASAMQFSVTSRSGATVYRRTNLASSTYNLSSSNISVSSSPIEIYPNGLAADTLLFTVSATRSGKTHSRRVHVSRAGLVRVD
jgi:Tfp pilus assembly protein FimT